MRRLIFERVLEAASGKTTKSDAVGFGQLNFCSLTIGKERLIRKKTT